MRNGLSFTSLVQLESGTVEATTIVSWPQDTISKLNRRRVGLAINDFTKAIAQILSENITPIISDIGQNKTLVSHISGQPERVSLWPKPQEELMVEEKVVFQHEMTPEEIVDILPLS